MGRPSTITLPVAEGTRPASARVIMFAPEPIWPAMQTMQPRGATIEKSCTALGTRRLLTIMRAPRSARAAALGYMSVKERPSISSTSCARVISLTGPVVTCAPLRSTVTESQSSKTSPSRCVT